MASAIYSTGIEGSRGRGGGVTARWSLRLLRGQTGNCCLDGEGMKLPHSKAVTPRADHTQELRLAPRDPSSHGRAPHAPNLVWPCPFSHFPSLPTEGQSLVPCHLSRPESPRERSPMCLLHHYVLSTSTGPGMQKALGER